MEWLKNTATESIGAAAAKEIRLRSFARVITSYSIHYTKLYDLIFVEHARSPAAYLALLAGDAAVFAVTCLLLLRADDLLRLLGAFGAVIVTRLMGLVLAFLAVQYVVDGIRRNNFV